MHVLEIMLKPKSEDCIQVVNFFTAHFVEDGYICTFQFDIHGELTINHSSRFSTLSGTLCFLTAIILTHQQGHHSYTKKPTKMYEWKFFRLKYTFLNIPLPTNNYSSGSSCQNKSFKIHTK